MSETRHTPGALKVQRMPDTKDAVPMLLDSGGNAIAELWPVDDNGLEDQSGANDYKDFGPITQANAARLALCWNLHDRLVRALKAAERMLDCNEWSDPTDIADQQEITAALAAAQEKP